MLGNNKSNQENKGFHTDSTKQDFGGFAPKSTIIAALPQFSNRTKNTENKYWEPNKIIDVSHDSILPHETFISKREYDYLLFNYNYSKTLYYILDKSNNIQRATYYDWINFNMYNSNRIVNHTKLFKYEIITYFMGLNYELFLTWISDNKTYCLYNYNTYDKAVEGHKYICNLIWKGEFKLS
jgi:hypothetical protein